MHRKRVGMTQKQLGAQVGTSGPVICHLERGRSMPMLPFLIRIASTLGASLDELAESQPAKWDREGIIP
jgi:transcriptional regulator with XRE-family HTH domain